MPGWPRWDATTHLALMDLVALPGAVLLAADQFAA